jgi:hypothetical protein
MQTFLIKIRDTLLSTLGSLLSAFPEAHGWRVCREAPGDRPAARQSLPPGRQQWPTGGDQSLSRRRLPSPPPLRGLPAVVRWRSCAAAVESWKVIPTMFLEPEEAPRPWQTLWFSLGGWTPLFPGEEEVAAAMVAAITDQRERTGGGRRSMQ